MMRIITGVPLLLTFLLVMFRAMLFRPLDCKNDSSWQAYREKEQRNVLLVDGNIGQPFPSPGDGRRNTGVSAITYICNA